MGRTAALIWHASSCVAAAALYFFFVLPRWPELIGQTSPTLGTGLRIVTGALIASAAIAVLAMSAFYLAFVAELPPPPAQPVKTTQDADAAGDAAHGTLRNRRPASENSSARRRSRGGVAIDD